MSARLLQLHLINFKCFEDHVVHFNETTIIIGENNAGKSTIVEALRILGLGCTRLLSARILQARPDWLDAPAALRGIRITTKDIDVELHHVFSRYGDPPAIIEGKFSDMLSVAVYINSKDELFVVLKRNEKSINTYDKVRESGLPTICVLPQIVPLHESETAVLEKTIRKNRFSKRMSGNFRTMLYDQKLTDEFERFQQLISETWNGILVSSLRKEENTVFLDLRDKDFVTEIYYMGHGVQMWLQTMWFITISGYDSIIVLDEPDVYMHADLQRKLIRMLKGKYNQTIIATHSVEIMSEVLPNEILIVNRRNPESIFADTYPELQTVIKRMGSIHNINLARLLNSKKYLYVEGSDFSILKILYDRVFPDAHYPLDYITCTPTGGWGSWTAQLQNAKQFMTEMPKLKIYFIYDRDYYSDAIVNKRYEEARRNHVFIHIWQRKELENYLLFPSAIARFVCKHRPELSIAETTNGVSSLIMKISDGMKQSTWDGIEDEMCKENSNVHASTYRKRFFPDFEKNWSNFQNRLFLLSGKKLFDALSDRCKRVYNVCFSDKQIASEINADELPQEMLDLLAKLGD